MKIIPVLDLMGGQVVRGVGGKRDQYRPITSKITPSAAPLDVASAFREWFGLSHLYIADLDAIAGKPPSVSIYGNLKKNGFDLWIDAGIKTEADADPLLEFGGIIAGLESLSGPDTLRQIGKRVGPDQIIFSLDLKNGKPLCRKEVWKTLEPIQIADFAFDFGIRKIIVLDLAQVGLNEGTTTQDLCVDMGKRHPEIEIITGGGIRDAADLLQLRERGINGVLVASALHDGSLTRDEIESI